SHAPSTRTTEEITVKDWVKIKSWHLTSGLVSRTGLVHTLCGKWAPAGTPGPLPANAKSCERCFQLREQAG
ncbi:MAG TPA: hypothetical protein VLD58_11215, partial [Gemmatimonadales bacterium]|nr:hypothetical protein [Gemmatimonadales bacterium]